jgi:hypothetical protein
MKSFLGLLFVTAVCSGCCPAVVAQAIAEPADKQIVLTGILKIVHGFGPPGYGANKKVDVKISYWTLALSFEVNLARIPDTPDLADIQCGPTNRPWLVFSEAKGSESKARELINKQATLTGILRRRTTNSQPTPVYMDVVDIVPVVRKK